VWLIVYEYGSIFRKEKFNSASMYDTLPSEYVRCDTALILLLDKDNQIQQVNIKLHPVNMI
jgi:hypothetical protein